MASRKSTTKTASKKKTPSASPARKKATAATKKSTAKVVKTTAVKTGRTPSRGAKTARRRSVSNKDVRLTVRHYCQGIGDCHLLRFKKDDGSFFNMLIDCGVHSSVLKGNDTIRKIAENIKSEMDERNEKIDILVATHEHWDHLSGFLTAKDVFEGVGIGELWMGWTENGKDKQARTLDKYKDKAIAALQGASRHLDHAIGLSPYLQGVQVGLQAVTGFYFGAAGDRVRSARDAAVELANNKVRYLEPASAPLSIPGLSDLRIYVLGPPRDEASIRVTDRTSEMYGLSMSRSLSMSTSLLNAVANYDGLSEQAEDDVIDPFDRNLGTPLSDVVAATDVANLPSSTETERQFKELSGFIARHYSPQDQAWRRIDMDWLGISSDLAMQLDNRTNNTSLVLAFEFIESGRVFLFTADAQVGSWLSWQDLSWTIDGKTVTGPDLLRRTVYYKVGHHGSQNATLKAKGLELMNSPDLASFVPTNEVDAKKVRWGQMPFKDIMSDLTERAAGRVVRADDKWVTTGQVPAHLATPSGAILATRAIAELCVEFDLA